MTVGDSLAHLAGALRAAGAGQLPGVAPLLHKLEHIGALIRVHNTCAVPAEAAALRAGITAQMTALAPAARHPLALDVRLNGHVSIPRQVLDEAAAAAGVLLRLSTRPSGSMAWLEYHARFRDRYGPGALVPVRDLVADSGLGYPDGYPGTVPARPVWRALTERDAALLALIQQVTLDGSGEIVLTEADIQALTTSEHADLVPRPRIELGVTLCARSAAAIRSGDFELRVVAVPRTPTSMAGRFAHLLEPGERKLLCATYQARDSGQEAVAVQLSFPPRVPHNENVVRVAPLVAEALPLGEHPAAGAGVIRVDDLAVTADAAQMYLVHRPTGRRVIPQIPHALDTMVQTPPLARFLAEVADARSAGFGPFDLGGARTLPYVPRIRYRRTVLSPARWLLATDDLTAGQDGGRWEERLAAWRQRWRVPARVVACHGELRLPLDLEHALDRSLLRAQVERAGRIELREDGPPGGDRWLGRPAELLIPFTLSTAPPRPLPVMAAPGTVLRPGAGTLMCAQLAGNPARFDDIIGVHLPRLAAQLAGLAERWWVRRHRDMIRPGTPQHVAVYLRLAPRGFAGAAAELASFAADLDARGLPGQLALASCPEYPARYGHGDALAAAENVFAADTAAAIAQLALAAAGDVPGQALAAASMTQLAASFAPDPATGYQTLIRCLEQAAGPLDRALCGWARRLADPAGDFMALRGLPRGDAVAGTWAARDTALTLYYRALAGQRDPGTVLRTLLHEHHMRALGLDPQAEKQTGRMARAAALQRLALAGRL